jgi:asparagine synthetase B (glutamine-hydrolysing)
MCGIYASISTQAFRQPSEVAKQSLCSRGPDHVGELCSQISMLNGRTYWISLTSTVLALRGGHVTAQPFKDALNGSCLCWNGEAWKIGPDTVTGNDGQAVFDALMKASSTQVTSKSSDDVLRVLRSIAGPFAFIFLDLINNQIYFGRDRLGRRSLLFKSDEVTTSLEFSSVADPTSGPWSEIEADAIYQLSLDENATHPPQEFKSDRFLKSFAPIHIHKWNAVPLDLSVRYLCTYSSNKILKRSPSQSP